MKQSQNGPRWDSIPVGPIPHDAVEVTENGWGFMAAGCLIELGLPGAVARTAERRNRSGVLEDPAGGGKRFELGPGELDILREGVVGYLGDAGMEASRDRLAHAWYIHPPAGVPAGAFWPAINAEPAVATAGPEPLDQRRGMAEALRRMYERD
jgi:hypothetical protein